MDLIRPTSPREVAQAMADLSAAGRPVAVAGAGRHEGRGPLHDAEVRLETTALAGTESYEPAEMIAVVGAGTRVGDLAGTLSEGGQEWACDAPDDATVGGVIAAAVNSPRMLRVGPVRDSVLEVVLATGDGRLIKGGGRVVKNVTGYDLPRLAVGSLGTLGVITQVALKVRPLPKARSTLTWDADAPLDLGIRLLASVPSPVAVIATPDAVTLHLEGWPDEVQAQVRSASGVSAPDREVADRPLLAPAAWQDRAQQVEAGVVPSHLSELAAAAGGDWCALLGVGLLWAGFDDPVGAENLCARAAELGGCATVISGRAAAPDRMRAALPAPQIHERLKRSFDPAGILPSLAGVTV